MGKIRRAAQPAGELGEHAAHIQRFPRFRQTVSLLLQEALHLFVCQYSRQPAFAVDVHKIPVVAHAALQHPHPQALGLKLDIPVFHAACKVGAVAGLVAEQARRFQAGQHRGTLFDHDRFKIALHVCALPPCFSGLLFPGCTVFIS